MQCLPEQKGLVVHSQILLDHGKLIILDTVHYWSTLDLFSHLLQSLHRCCMEVLVCREDHLNDDLSDLLIVFRRQVAEDVQVHIFKKDEGLRD